MIDRSLFVPQGTPPDQPYPFDGERTVPGETVTRELLRMLDLKPGEKVLEIGTGSGYQTACLLSTGAKVFTIDRYFPTFWETPQYRATLAAVSLVCDGRLGWECSSPFDAISISCGVEEIPRPLIDQLKENGRLVAPVGSAAKQELTKFVKRNGELHIEEVGAYVRFSMME